MPIWQDPYDELIEQLERVVPEAGVDSSYFPFQWRRDLIESSDILMWPMSEEERRKRFESSPAHQRLMAWERARSEQGRFEGRRPNGGRSGRKRG